MDIASWLGFIAKAVSIIAAGTGAVIAILKVVGKLVADREKSAYADGLDDSRLAKVEEGNNSAHDKIREIKVDISELRASSISLTKSHEAMLENQKDIRTSLHQILALLNNRRSL